MQVQTNAGIRQPDATSPPKSNRSSPAEFASLLGTLFAAVPALQSPAVVGNSRPPDRSASSRDVPDAVRPDNAGVRRTEADDERAVQERNVESSTPAGSDSSPVRSNSRTTGTEIRDGSISVSGGDGSANRNERIASANAPAGPASPTPSVVTPEVPEIPAAAVFIPVGLPVSVIAPQDLENARGSNVLSAPTVEAPATAGALAGTGPAIPITPVPQVATVAKAGDVPVSAAAPSSAEPQVPTVPVSGTQAGPTSPSLRTAKPEGPLAPSSVERVAAAVRAQASLGGGRVKILLNPPHLGALRIEVVVRNSVLFAHMETESQAARHSLQQHLTDLKQSLEEHGLSLGHMSVSVSHREGSGSEGSFSSAPHPFVFEPEAEPSADSRPELRNPRLLDVTV